MTVPYGSVVSYRWIAEKSGHPGAFRAAGQALGRNPVPIAIPCHRVVASGGKLGGFSGGLHWKEKMLAMEGIEI
jgi:methylated-DNA-[protein]-cysteine S-methyltransferase